MSLSIHIYIYINFQLFVQILLNLVWRYADYITVELSLKKLNDIVILLKKLLFIVNSYFFVFSRK